MINMNYEKFSNAEKLSINQFINWVSKIDESKILHDRGGIGFFYAEDPSEPFKNFISFYDMLNSICLLNSVLLSNAYNKILPFAYKKCYWRPDILINDGYGLMTKKEHKRILETLLDQSLVGEKFNNGE